MVHPVSRRLAHDRHKHNEHSRRGSASFPHIPAPEKNTKQLIKLATTIAHIGAAAGLIALVEEAGGALGLVGANICVCHIALLLGIWGPTPGELSWWWVPSPMYEPVGCLIFLIIGLLHFFGVGLVTYRSLDVMPCPHNLVDIAEATASLPQDMSVAAAVSELLAEAGCATPPTETAFEGPCVEDADGCAACEACPLAYMEHWYFDMVAEPESTPLGAGVAAALDAESCEAGDFSLGQAAWVVRMTVIDRLWFCLVLLTTVGYGNTFVPTNTQSRTFTLVWALFGLIVFGASSSAVMNMGMKVLQRWRHNRQDRWRGSAADPASVADVDVDVGSEGSTVRGVGEESCAPKGEPPHMPPEVYLVARGLYINFVIFIVLNLGGAAIFVALEDGWALFDGFYHCMMTATTIGLGDIAPTSQEGRVYGMVHLVLSALLFGSILGTILNGFDVRTTAERKQTMLDRSLDPTLLAELDKDGKGLDQSAFVLGMLEVVGLVKEDDIRQFSRQFKKLDVTGDGRLNKDDILKGAKASNDELAASKEQQRALDKAYQGRARKHAIKLLTPTFVACFGFLWYNLFGFVLLVSGLIRGLAIGTCLGSRPSPANFRKAAVLTALGSACLAFAVTLVLVFLADPAHYFAVDKIITSVGPLNEDGLTTAGDADIYIAVFSPIVKSSSSIALFTIYLMLFVYALGMDVQMVVCSLRAAAELENAPPRGPRATISQTAA